MEHKGFHNKEHYSPECDECKQSVVVGRKDFYNEVCLDCGLSRTTLREMLKGDRGNRVTAFTAIMNCKACKKALRGVNNGN